MASIVIASGERHGDHYALGRRTNVIGRAESLPIQVLDERVSRKHVQIRFDSETGCYWAVDLGSRNGVFIDGVRIVVATQLRHRDKIRLGGTLLMFTEHDLNEDTAAWHRFKKPGERRKPTQVDWSVDEPALRLPAAIAAEYAVTPQRSNNAVAALEKIGG